MNAIGRRSKLSDELEVERVRAELRRRLFAEPLAEVRIGRFPLLNRLDQATTSEQVYAAYDTELDRKIVIRVLGVMSATELHDAQARLRREGHALGRAAHAGIAEVIDVGVHRDRVFVASEFLVGPDLGRWLTAQRRSVTAVLAQFVAVGDALAAAHAAGVVHGRVSASCVRLGRDGRPRIVGFGLGDPSGADAAADQLAFAVALASALDVSRPSRPRRVRPMLERALAGDPQQRHPDMPALLHELRSLARSWLVRLGL